MARTDEVHETMISIEHSMGQGFCWEIYFRCEYRHAAHRCNKRLSCSYVLSTSNLLE